MSESEHPTADNEIESLESDIKDKQDEIESLQRGELQPPWPRTSRHVAILGIATLIAAGGMFASGVQDMYFVFAVVLIAVGVALLNWSRWLHRHFEIGDPPRYTVHATDGSGDGGDD